MKKGERRAGANGYKGSMDKDYVRALRHYVEGQARPVDKYGHQPRLEALTEAVGTEMEYDREVVVAAAWLHDLGVFVGNRPEDTEELARWDHVGYACLRGREVLREAGFPEEKIAAVLEVIRQHQPKDEPQTIEATILRDADILEQLGAMGILRTVSKVGRDTRFPRFTDAAAALRRNLEELPDRIRLESTRRLARSRIEILKKFLDAVDDEAGSALY